MKTFYIVSIFALLLSPFSVVKAQCPIGYGTVTLRDASTLNVVSASNPLVLDHQYYIDVEITPPMDPGLVIVVMRSVSGGLGYKNYTNPDNTTTLWQTIPPAQSGIDTGAESTSKILRFSYYSSPDAGDISNQISVTLRAECSGTPRKLQTPSTTRTMNTYY
jgi:hypothetical protein